MAISSHKFSASSISCVVTIMLLPCFATCSLINSYRLLLEIGSNPFEGSSNTRILSFPIKLTAKAVFLFYPPERSLITPVFERDNSLRIEFISV